MLKCQIGHWYEKRPRGLIVSIQFYKNLALSGTQWNYERLTSVEIKIFKIDANIRMRSNIQLLSHKCEVIYYNIIRLYDDTYNKSTLMELD